MAPARPTLTHRLVSGGAWVVASRVFQAAAVLVVSALLSRLLEPGALGAYFLTHTVVTLAATLALAGMNHAVVRFSGEALGQGRPGRAAGAIGLGFRYAAAGAVLVGGLVAFGVGPWLATHVFQSAPMRSVIWIGGIWCAAFAIQTLVMESFRGLQELRLAAWFGGPLGNAVMVAALASLWLARGEAQLAHVVAVAAGAFLVGAAVGVWRLRRSVAGLGPIEPVESRAALAFALPMLVQAIVTYGRGHADLWILGSLRSQDELAVYATAFRLVSIVQVPMMVTTMLVASFVAELNARGERLRLERLLRNSATVAAAVSLTALLPLVFFAPQMLGLVFGDYYRAGAPLLVLLSCGRLISIGTGPSGVTLAMTGHQATLLRITIAATALSVLGILWAVGPYGALGVAAVTALGQIFFHVACWLSARQLLGVWTHVGWPRTAELRGLLRSLRALRPGDAAAP